jgi:hypothetical protein
MLSAAVSSWAATVKDQLGRDVQIPDHPKCIVCLLPDVVDDVYGLSVGSNVIAGLLRSPDDSNDRDQQPEGTLSRSCVRTAALQEPRFRWVTGRGTGLNDHGLQRKRDVLQRVLAFRRHPRPS